jgi:negative regulator of flagellin synthesis FlgM
MEVNGIPGAVPPPGVEPVGAVQADIRAAQSAGITDTAEVSTIAKLVAQVNALPDVRADLVERVRAEIAAGTYETPERMDVAIDRLTDDLLANP